MHCSKSIRKFKLIIYRPKIYKSHFDVPKVILLMSGHLPIFCANVQCQLLNSLPRRLRSFNKTCISKCRCRIDTGFFYDQGHFLWLWPVSRSCYLNWQNWQKELSNIFFANNSPVLCWQRPGHSLGKNVKFHETKKEKKTTFVFYT